MTQVFESYQKVFTALQQKNDELLSAYRTINKAESEYSRSASSIASDLEAALDTVEKNISKVNAFLAIGKTHTHQLKNASKPQPFDSGALSRLAVQINSGSRNDPFAAQLYTAADGQIRYLEQQKDVLQAEQDQKLSALRKSLSEARVNADSRIRQIESSIRQYLRSAEFDAFVSELKNDQSVFDGRAEYSVLPSSKSGTVSIGSLEMPFPIPDGMESAFLEATGGLCDVSQKQISIPARISVDKGNVLIAEYQNSSESEVLSGVQNMILNIARHYGRDFAQIVYIDPIRFNASSLGCLSRLTGRQNSLIDPVPSSIEEVRKKVKSILTDITIRDARSERLGVQSKKKALYIFHDFPQAYDANLVAQIQQLCMNAEHYGFVVVLTHNNSSKHYISEDVLQYIKTVSTSVTSLEDGFEMKITGGSSSRSFKWYQAPYELPGDLEKHYIQERPVIDLSNDYNKRIGFADTPQYHKGRRAIENIPYGIDENGTLQYLDFENSNFATFICGASRSGKSTLLHTLISGMIKNNHPDDIEIWLIDFKMTEFSRYIKHLPPHVRYIILDESPELVYDIIDRLSEILVKRQILFKGKWNKLSDVPPEKYMPAIMVIIDEFSVMSRIIADPDASTNDDYIAKLQTLLAMGSGLGLYFIFSSQGFTSGIRGLNDYSKKQIQQRIAMKTEYNEIKETLDLKSASETDKALMEQLPVHHALMRIPADEHGNHLKLSQVLYISDYAQQEAMIDRICDSVSPVAKYDPADNGSYISKRPMVVDGNLFLSFASKQEEIQAYIQSHKEHYAFNDEYSLFVGEPRRMLSLYPISITNEFCENLLLLSTSRETMAASSILLSMARSLELQGQQMELWSTRKNPVYRQIKMECRAPVRSIVDFDQICDAIRRLKERIQSKIEGRKLIVLLGFETLLTDMSYQTDGGGGYLGGPSEAGVIYEKRGEDEPDLLSQLDALLRGETPPASVPAPSEEAPDDRTLGGAYDARDDLKYILTNGPRLGYHFMMCFRTVADFQVTRIDSSIFRHKLIFRSAKADAMGILGHGNAAVVSELEDHSFRYSNGLDSLSFRPYLHRGLSWDGWKLDGDTVVNAVDEEEEYLL